MGVLKGGSQDDLTLKYLLEKNKPEIDLSEITDAIDNINGEIGDTHLPTTAQTITGAIDEHETDISSLSVDIDDNTHKVISITLPYSNWTADSNNADVYYQTVSIANGTNKTKVDLQADTATLLQLLNDGVSCLHIENDNAVFKAWAIGAAPTANITVQGTRVETE